MLQGSYWHTFSTNLIAKQHSSICVDHEHQPTNFYIWFLEEPQLMNRGSRWDSIWKVYICLSVSPQLVYNKNQELRWSRVFDIVPDIDSQIFSPLPALCTVWLGSPLLFFFLFWKGWYCHRDDQLFPAPPSPLAPSRPPPPPHPPPSTAWRFVLTVPASSRALGKCWKCWARVFWLARKEICGRRSLATREVAAGGGQHTSRPRRGREGGRGSPNPLSWGASLVWPHSGPAMAPKGSYDRFLFFFFNCRKESHMTKHAFVHDTRFER